MIPALSLFALFLTIVIGIIKPKINIGIVALSFAALLGLTFAGLKEKEIVSLFPSSLFITLLGVTLFFGIFEANGLLGLVSSSSMLLARGKSYFLPLIFFVFTTILSASGPGNIAATALVAPIGMATAYVYGINPLLMAIMICTGANAGAFSPIAPTGVILTELGKKIGVLDMNVYIQIFLAAAFIQSISAIIAFFIFSRDKNKKIHDGTKNEIKKIEIEKLNTKHIVSILAVLALLAGVVFFKLPLGLTAITLSVILLIAQIADQEEVFAKIPWDAIILVCGVSVLIGVLEKSGGLDLATSIIAKMSNPQNINAFLAFVTGLVSAYSSSSGVVMPAFIPLIPSLIAKLGGGDIVKMLIATSVGSHMVDVSPLSTLGALCIAQVKMGKQKLFRDLMIWGLSMAIFGALISYILLDLL